MYQISRTQENLDISACAVSNTNTTKKFIQLGENICIYIYKKLSISCQLSLVTRPMSPVTCHLEKKKNIFYC